jgi:hypothetical protein
LRVRSIHIGKLAPDIFAHVSHTAVSWHSEFDLRSCRSRSQQEQARE